MKNFLRLINIEVDDIYAEMLFQVIIFIWGGKKKKKSSFKNLYKLFLTDVCTEM